MLIEVEVPCPEGYKVIDFKKPHKGDSFLLNKMVIAYAHFDYKDDYHFIVIEVYTLPSFIHKDRWIFRHCDVWYITTREPISTGIGYYSEDCVRLDKFAALIGHEIDMSLADQTIYKS